MRSAVRSLQRHYACLVAQAALGPVADDYVECWEAASERGEPPPDLPDLFLAVASAGVPVVAYLRACAEDGRVPEPRRIVQAIAHAYAELDIRNLDKTCHCPASRPLIALPSRLRPPI